MTNGQWLQINMITVALEPLSLFKDRFVLLFVSSKVKSGASVFKANMFDGVLAMNEYIYINKGM